MEELNKKELNNIMEELNKKELKELSGGCFAFDAGWALRWLASDPYTKSALEATYGYMSSQHTH